MKRVPVVPGVILRPSDVSWMPANRAWASCIVFRNGYFCFYASNEWTIGVLRSTSITSPFQDMLGRALINQNTPNNTPNPVVAGTAEEKFYRRNT